MTTRPQGTLMKHATFWRTGKKFTPLAGKLTDGRESAFGSLVTIPREAGARQRVLDALEVGARCDRHWIRVDVARHAYASVEQLELLADDEDVRVRRAAARHPHARSRLGALARDEDAIVRWGVAGNDDAPTTALLTLARDDDVRVATVAARALARRRAAGEVGMWEDASLLDDGA